MSTATTAARYLRAAAANVDLYGDGDTIGMLVAEMYGAAAYGEGDIMEIAARLVAASKQAIDDGASRAGAPKRIVFFSVDNAKRFV